MDSATHAGHHNPGRTGVGPSMIQACFLSNDRILLAKCVPHAWCSPQEVVHRRRSAAVDNLGSTPTKLGAEEKSNYPKPGVAGALGFRELLVIQHLVKSRLTDTRCSVSCDLSLLTQGAGKDGLVRCPVGQIGITFARGRQLGERPGRAASHGSYVVSCNSTNTVGNARHGDSV